AAPQVANALEVHCFVLAAAVELALPRQTCFGDVEELARQLPQFDATNAGMQRLAMDGVIQRESLFPTPAFDHVPRRPQAIVVMEDTLDERRRRQHQLGRLTVDRAGCDVPL